MTRTIRTTCPYCGVGCGVLASIGGDQVTIAGDPAHPANRGRLCSKGAALGETLGLESRLLHPVLHGQRVSWDDALTHVAEGFLKIIREHGPEAVAFYVSGQLLTEDYYVVNKLMKGYIGSANVDTNSRLCMASAVAGHRRAFGEDVVPVSYDDLELADLVVLVGSNLAWCHPVLHQRLAQAKAQRPDLRIVVIDPRRTPTCDIADLHLPIRSGSDVWLFNGLLTHLCRRGAGDTRFVAANTTGLIDALGAASRESASAEAVARACGVDPERIEQFYALFAARERTITVFSQGVNQSSAGTDKVNSIINCHLVTGRIGRPGMGPFSVTGQPNAMGGREVGGLANMLAAHLELENPAHRRIVQDFWASPRIADRPGLKAVDLFEAVHAGRVKAVWIMATNPVVSLPNADRVRAALERCELVVVSDCIERTDTNALAHVLLPAAAWGEKNGTVTNSERRISRQRAFLPLPGEAKPDWWIVCEVARRMGFARGFDYGSPAGIFDEHARLSAAANENTRAFDIRGLAGMSPEEYDALEPVQWPVRSRDRRDRAERPFSDGRFFHADGKARFVPTPPRAPVHAVSDEYPFVLNTGRIRDQWHTMTRTGNAPRLSAHLPEPHVDMHPQDALLAGAKPGDLVRVSTSWGSLVARLRTSGEIARGAIFVPMHWSDRFASHARVGALVSPAVDPISGEPEFKHTPARIELFPVKWHGFVLTRELLPEQFLRWESASHQSTLPGFVWWALARGEQSMRYEVAGREVPRDWTAWARRLLGAQDVDADYLDWLDTGTGAYRAAYLMDDRLVACLFVSPRPDLPSRSWLASLFTKPCLDARDRAALLAGAVPRAASDPGPVVCSCFGVGRNTIREAIAAQQLRDARQVGEKLRAGTHCGSCLPEIRALLAC